MNSFVPLESPGSVVSILSQISLFGGVTDSQQDTIFQRLECGIFKKGQNVFKKGDEPSHIYIVKSGNVELLIPDDDVVIEKKKLGVGECFGYVALMSMYKHTITAVAIEDSEIIVLSRRALHQLRYQDIELFALLMMNIARELARRLRFTDNMLLDCLHPHEEGEGSSKITRP